MSILTRPILEINLNNLLDNYNVLSKIAEGSVPAAVIKDDAYGLGAQKIVSLLYEKANVRCFFVAHAIEAQELAENFKDAKFYVLQGIGEDSAEIFKKYKQLVPVISAPEMLSFWRSLKINDRKAVIQVETGLNRLGFRSEELKQLSNDELSSFEMVMSHLACADEKAHFMNEHQLSKFNAIKDTYFPDICASLAASDGVFLGKFFHKTMVRLGAAMYGINTAPYRPNQMKNVVTLKAPVLQIADLPKGEFVGYSATYRASSKRKIAIVSIGYGDGLPRSLSNVGKVFFTTANGIEESRIIGRVSMDNVICDVTDVSDVKVGDLAILSGDFYTLDDVARDAGTISYELMSRLGKNKRIDKKYI